jgi:hypothetical protein
MIKRKPVTAKYSRDYSPAPSTGLRSDKTPENKGLMEMQFSSDKPTNLRMDSIGCFQQKP